MKKIITLILLILILYSINTYAASGEVKVGLRWGDSAISDLNVTCKGGTLITDIDGKELYRNENTTKIYVAKGANNNIDVYADNTLIAYHDSSLYIVPIGGLITHTEMTYRGKFLFRRYSSGNLVLINQLGMDEYLCGVLPREIGEGAPLEAMKAQAVCARSYALRAKVRHKDLGFDMCYTDHCQVYGNISRETDKIKEAVFGTSGIVGRYKGEICNMVYTNSDGGHTENNEDVWIGDPIPYLRGVPDPYETDEADGHTWSYTFTKAQLTEILSAQGLGNIQDLNILSTSDYGAVTKLEIVGSNGTKTYNRELCRTVFKGKIHSQVYTIVKSGSEGTLKLNGVSNTGAAPLPSKINVIGKNGLVWVDMDGVRVISSDGVSTLQSTKGTADSFTITGKGWGHHVGMSQWGAIAMAKQGFTYDKILTHFYTGITLGE